MERANRARELVREVSLRENEDSMVVSDGGIGVDKVRVDVGVDSDAWAAGGKLNLDS